MEKKGAHNSHATASENGANHGFLGVRQSIAQTVLGTFQIWPTRGTQGFGAPAGQVFEWSSRPKISSRHASKRNRIFLSF